MSVTENDGGPIPILDVIDSTGCEKSIECNLKIYAAFRDYVEHEDSLVNQRMTWMLTIHGFLYASYAFTLQKKFEVFSKMGDVSLRDFILGNGVWASLIQLEAFLFVVAAVGIVVSSSAYHSIQAADSALTALRRVFLRQFPNYSVDMMGWQLLDPAKVLRSRYRQHNRFIDRVVRLEAASNLYLPSITGGGNDFAMQDGSSASTRIPWWLRFSWFVAIGFSIMYIISVTLLISEVDTNSILELFMKANFLK